MGIKKLAPLGDHYGPLLGAHWVPHHRGTNPNYLAKANTAAALITPTPNIQYAIKSKIQYATTSKIQHAICNKSKIH